MQPPHDRLTLARRGFIGLAAAAAVAAMARLAFWARNDAAIELAGGEEPAGEPETAAAPPATPVRTPTIAVAPVLRAAHGKPNILFILADDQRFDTIRALGNRQVSTPNLDKLAARGVSFTRAYTPGGMVGALCVPSRAMILTGRTLFHLTESGNLIPPEHTLLGELFARNGYRAFATGKWHNDVAAFARGFNAGAEILFGGLEDHWNVPVCRFNAQGKYPAPTPFIGNPWASNELSYRIADHVTIGKHSSELFADAAIEGLKQDPDDPVFLYLSLMAPHDPRTSPPEFRNLYDPATIDLPANFLPRHPFDIGEMRERDELLAGFPRTPAEIRRHIADYYGMISHLDAQLGRVFDALDKSGRADNTIIVFAGDNGIAIGQHGLMGKQNLYECSLRVPLIMAGPGVPKGVRRDALVYLGDIYPTLCELTGLPKPPSVESKSLVGVLADPLVRLRDSLYLAFRDGQRAVRGERYKLIQYVTGGTCHTQLFDLDADPLETRNLAQDAAGAEPLARLRDVMAAERDASGDAQTPQGKAFWDNYSRLCR